MASLFLCPPIVTVTPSSHFHLSGNPFQAPSFFFIKYFWNIQTIIQLFSIKKNIFFRVMIEVFSISVPYWKISVRYRRIRVRYLCWKGKVFPTSPLIHTKSRHVTVTPLQFILTSRHSFFPFLHYRKQIIFFIITNNKNEYYLLLHHI